MVHWSFIRRQIMQSKQESLIFTACVVLSILTLVALHGFHKSVNLSMMQDARRLQGGDIILRSHQEFSSSLREKVQDLERKGLIRALRVYELYTMVRSGEVPASVLSRIKVVGPEYPLYGQVDLASGTPMTERLQQGHIVVEQALLDRLHARVGDRLKIGETELSVADIVISEPDRPVSLFSLGPRAFVSLADVEALGLISKVSRVEHVYLLRASQSEAVDRLASELGRDLLPGQERIDTYRTATSGVKKFFDNLLFFLTMVGLFILILAGLGIQSALASLLKDKESTVGVLKALGARSRFIVLQYVLILTCLGFVGSLAGICAGMLLQSRLPVLFESLIPQDVVLTLSWAGVFEGFMLGTFAVGLFTFIPMYQLSHVKPSIILRKDDLPGSARILNIVLSAFMSLLFGVMALWQLRDTEASAYLVLGLLGFLLCIAAVTDGALRLIKRVHWKELSFRQAVRGIFRPRNATRPIIVTLTASLTLILCISTLERNLAASFVQSYPEDAPNVFFLDIQSDQRDSFDRQLGHEARYYPVVRARVVSVNGQPVDYTQERMRRGDNLSREFNLTYRDDLLPEESILEGNHLFHPDPHIVSVSLLERVVEMMHVRLGDRILFNIQGVPLEGVVSSIRAQSGSPMQPFFYFVFPTEILRDAPQTIFTALRVAPESIPKLQNRIVSQFPNVTVIDVTQSIGVFSRLIEKLSGILQFFTGFSIAAGVLIIMSATLATRMARIREAVYFKILGATPGFVFKVVLWENLILGCLSGLIALAISQISAWAITRHFLDVTYQPHRMMNGLLAWGVILLVLGVGLMASLSVLRQKPAVFLREQSEG